MESIVSVLLSTNWAARIGWCKLIAIVSPLILSEILIPMIAIPVVRTILEIVSKVVALVTVFVCVECQKFRIFGTFL